MSTYAISALVCCVNGKWTGFKVIYMKYVSKSYILLLLSIIPPALCAPDTDGAQELIALSYPAGMQVSWVDLCSKMGIDLVAHASNYIIMYTVSNWSVTIYEIYHQIDNIV